MQVVIGMLANKDAAGFLAPLRHGIAHLHVLPVPGHEHHGPELFAALAADWGIEVSAHTDPTTAAALRRSVDPLSADDFPQQLMDLVAYLDGASNGSVRAVPNAAQRPPVWLLGSSGYSAQLAGMLGLPFAFAHHFSPDNTLPALDLYRRHFAPSDVLDEPYAIVAAQVL